MYISINHFIIQKQPFRCQFGKTSKCVDLPSANWWMSPLWIASILFVRYVLDVIIINNSIIVMGWLNILFVGHHRQGFHSIGWLLLETPCDPILHHSTASLNQNATHWCAILGRWLLDFWIVVMLFWYCWNGWGNEDVAALGSRFACWLLVIVLGVVGFTSINDRHYSSFVGCYRR